MMTTTTIPIPTVQISYIVTDATINKATRKLVEDRVIQEMSRSVNRWFYTR